MNNYELFALIVLVISNATSALVSLRNFRLPGFAPAAIIEWIGFLTMAVVLIGDGIAGHHPVAAWSKISMPLFVVGAIVAVIGMALYQRAIARLRALSNRQK